MTKIQNIARWSKKIPPEEGQHWKKKLYNGFGLRFTELNLLLPITLPAKNLIAKYEIKDFKDFNNGEFKPFFNQNWPFKKYINANP